MLNKKKQLNKKIAAKNVALRKQKHMLCSISTANEFMQVNIIS